MTMDNYFKNDDDKVIFEVVAESLILELDKVLKLNSNSKEDSKLCVKKKLAMTIFLNDQNDPGLKATTEKELRALSENLNNYHKEINTAENFLKHILDEIIVKSKSTLNCLQYNNIIIADMMPPIDDDNDQQPPSTLKQTITSSRLFPKKDHTKSKERPHECETCKKSFFTRKHLLTHIKSHNEDRPFSCEICKANFKFKNSLNLHMKSHSDARPFACDLCGVSFKAKNTLLQHAATHSGQKQYECEFCPMTFFFGRIAENSFDTAYESESVQVSVCGL